MEKKIHIIRIHHDHTSYHDISYSEIQKHHHISLIISRHKAILWKRKMIMIVYCISLYNKHTENKTSQYHSKNTKKLSKIVNSNNDSVPKVWKSDKQPWSYPQQKSLLLCESRRLFFSVSLWVISLFCCLLFHCERFQGYFLDPVEIDIDAKKKYSCKKKNNYFIHLIWSLYQDKDHHDHRP